MIRTKDWKYVARFPARPDELYHLAADPDEETNRVDDPACADILATLRGEGRPGSIDMSTRSLTAPGKLSAAKVSLPAIRSSNPSAVDTPPAKEQYLSVLCRFMTCIRA